eukprot:1374860-Amphidinium_carterae.4
MMCYSRTGQAHEGVTSQEQNSSNNAARCCCLVATRGGACTDSPEAKLPILPRYACRKLGGRLGAEDFVRSHLDALENRVRAKRQALKKLPQELGPVSNGIQLATILARTAIPSAVAHAQRAVPPQLQSTWAEAHDAANRELLEALWHVGTLTVADRQLLQLPLGEGGLQWHWAATAAPLQFLASSQSITAAQDMWQPELLQAEAD